MKISAFSLMLRTREKYWFFHRTRWNIFGIHLKKVNILYVLVTLSRAIYENGGGCREFTHRLVATSTKSDQFIDYHYPVQIAPSAKVNATDLMNKLYVKQV